MAGHQKATCHDLQPAAVRVYTFFRLHIHLADSYPGLLRALSMPGAGDAGASVGRVRDCIVEDMI